MKCIDILSVVCVSMISHLLYHVYTATLNGSARTLKDVYMIMFSKVAASTITTTTWKSFSLASPSFK